MQKGRSETHISSKSRNRNVLSIYNEILEHAYSDSEYWYLMGGDFLLDALYKFTDFDIEELKSDLPNWAFNELQIFWGALANDYSGSHDDLLPIRSYLYGYIFTLINYYVTVNPRAAIEILLFADDEFLTGGYIKDKELLQEMIVTLNNTEYKLLNSHEGYISQSRFDFLKQALQKLFEALD